MPRKPLVLGLCGLMLLAAAGMLTLAQQARAQDRIGNASQVTEVTIMIENMAFAPHTVVVATGATLTWYNGDSVTHTVTSEGGWIDSGPIAPDETFVWQPDRPGIFNYRCSLHPEMEGVVIVQPGGAVAPVPFDGQPVAEVYRDSCSGCHGPNREGATGVALIPGRLTADDQFYFDVIKHGQPGTVMPAWGSLGLSDEEIWMLVGFIHSEPTAEEIQWELPDIEASRAVLIDEASLPDAPTHTGNVDNLLLVTEREERSIAVFDGDTHTLLAHIPASYRAHGYAFDPTNERWAYNVG
ncbi:MAG TPA: c-type cytochrome, partial [Aggregatilineaceae bacterium]|nr:c-type cytochrome [Aggregatilineaceae bacterium]